MYLIRNVNIFAPEPKGIMDILVANDRICAMGKELDPELPGIEIIDGTGKTAVPGFIDQHVHILGGGGEGGFHSRPPELMLSEIVRAGVTTVVGLLGTDGHTRSVENLVAKTKALKNEGITAYCLTGSYEYPPINITGSAAKDIVYIDEIIGCKLAISDHRCSRPTREEITRLVSEVRIAGLISGKVGEVHLHVGAIGNAIREIMEIVKEESVPVTHFRPTHMENHPEQAIEFVNMGGYADFTTEPHDMDSLCQVIEAVGTEKLTVSSDAGGSIPVWDQKRERITGMAVGRMDPLFQVIKKLHLEHDLPLEKALSLITSNPAKALNFYPDKGTLLPGSHADLVLLDNELQIDTVMARGKIMIRDKKLSAKGTFEEIPVYKEEASMNA